MFIRITPERLVEALKAQGLTEMKAKVCAYDLMVASEDPGAREDTGLDLTEETPSQATKLYVEDSPSKPLLVGKKASKRINFKAFGGEAEALTTGSGIVSPSPGFAPTNFNEADEDDL